MSTRSRRSRGCAHSALRCATSYATELLEARVLLCYTGPGAPESVDGSTPVDPSSALFQLLYKATTSVEPTAKSGIGVWRATPSKSNTTAAVTAASPPTVVAAQPAGALSGKVIYTQGGHGYTYYQGGLSAPAWQTERPFLNNMVEDFGNQDEMTDFANYALQAGATVVPIRPVGNQVNQVIVDNADSGFSVISGSWTNGTLNPYWSNSNGGGTPYLQATGSGNAATETAVARFTPTITTAGFYPVYAWYLNGSDRASDAVYRINYSGGSFEVHVNETLTGKGWVYLGTYYFDTGTAGNVEVSNKSATTGKVIADAIMFGNGMGDWVSSGGTVSGQAKQDEAGLYWAYDSRGWTASGTRVSTTVVDSGSSSDDNTKNFAAPDRWATYMNDSTVGQPTDRLWLSFHSNASGGSGSGRGSMALINTVPTTNQAAYANIVGSNVISDMTAQNANWEFPWGTDVGPTYTGGYSEISNNVILGEFDATILEVAFHDNVSDADLLQDPKVRQAVARSCIRSVIQYFQTYDSLTNTTLLPEPPQNVRSITDNSGNVTISWDPGLSGAPYGDAATSYRVYTSTNGYGFNAPVTTTGTSLTISGLSTSAPTYFRVTAINAGGESFNSEVVSAKPQSASKAQILIVDNFTRLDRLGDSLESMTHLENLAGTSLVTGSVDRVRTRYNNTRDYTVQAASSINAFNFNLGIDTVSDSAIASGLVNLANYQSVIWMSGEQSSLNRTFTSTEQTLVTNYLNAGGKIFVSGSEVGFDLVSQGHGASFFNNTLHAAYVVDDDNTYNFASGVAGSAFASVTSGSFDNGTHGTYDVNAPDKLGTSAGSTIAMNYSGGSGGAAAVQYSSGSTRVIMMGFPLESVYTISSRNSIMSGALTFFGFSAGGLVAPTPGSLTLAAVSDAGTSNSDRITNFNNSSAAKALQFTVAGTTSGDTVTLYADGVAIGSTVAAGTSTSVTTNGTATLSNGTHSFTARQSLAGFVDSPDSPALSVTIDTIAPTATLAIVSSPRTSTLTSETMTFSESVGGVSTSSFTLKRDGGSNLLTASQTITGSGSNYSLNNLSTVTNAAGHFVLSIPASGSGITDIAGNPLTTAASSSWITNGISAAGGSKAIRLVRNSVTASSLDVYINNNTATPDYTVSLSGLGNVLVKADDAGDSLTVDASNGAPAFDGASGLTYDASTFAAPLFLTGGAGNDTADIYTNHSTLDGITITYINAPGKTQFSGGAGNDSLNINSGSLVFSADASATTSHLALTVESGASAVFNTTQHLAALVLDSGVATLAAGAGKVLVLDALTLLGTAKLDLNDDAMIVKYTGTSPIAAIRQSLQSAYGPGDWSGSTGITSSTAHADVVHPTTLGYAEASDLGVSTFAGEPITGDAVLIRYTYAGDSNLDGKVDLDNDFSLFVAGYNKQLNNPALVTPGNLWLSGDYNYDSTVNLDNDFSIFLNSYNSAGPQL